jgi:hypothetical protein
VIDTLKLSHQDNDERAGIDYKKNEWSPMDICDAWAVKRGYFTAKAARPDMYR